MAASQLVVVSANLAAKSKAWQRASWDARLPHITEGLKYFSPDVVCVQEAGDASNLRDLDARLAKIGLYRAPHGGRWRHIYFRPETLQLVSSGLFLLGGSGSNQRHAAHAKFRRHHDTSKRFMVTSAHLSQGWSSADDRARVREATQLVRQASAANPANWPKVHAGDFNSFHHVVDKVFIPAGFPDTIRHASEWVHNAEYDSFNGRTTVHPPPHAKLPKHGKHDDHICASLSLKPRFWTMRPDFDSSDHNFITCRFGAL